jgi:hypothetical protein
MLSKNQKYKLEALVSKLSAAAVSDLSFLSLSLSLSQRQNESARQRQRQQRKCADYIPTVLLCGLYTPRRDENLP